MKQDVAQEFFEKTEVSRYRIEEVYKKWMHDDVRIQILTSFRMTFHI